MSLHPSNYKNKVSDVPNLGCFDGQEIAQFWKPGIVANCPSVWIQRTGSKRERTVTHCCLNRRSLLSLYLMYSYPRTSKYNKTHIVYRFCVHVMSFQWLSWTPIQNGRISTQTSEGSKHYYLLLIYTMLLILEWLKA